MFKNKISYKYILLFAIFLIIYFTIIFIFNPIKISKYFYLKESKNILYNFFINKNALQKHLENLEIVDYKDILSNININIKTNQNQNTLLTFNIEQINKDTSVVIINSKMEYTFNIIKLIQNYFYAVKLKKIFDKIALNIKQIKDFKYEIYEILILHEKVKYDLFLSTKIKLINKYNLDFYNQNINKLKQYILNNGAMILDKPMLNELIINNDTILMIAFPISKPIKENNNYKIKQMFKGNIIHTTTIGGYFSINKTKNKIQNYIRDYSYVTPAIEFEVLTSERKNIKDSANWITDIYYPIY